MKLRFWAKNLGKMFYDKRLPEPNMTINEFLELNDQVVMISLGFSDINGKEVYEGDILKCWDGTGQVLYGGNGITLKKYTFHNNPSLIEVIGNKWENPELNKHE